MANFEALFGPSAGGYQPPQTPGAGAGIPGLNLGAPQAAPQTIPGLMLGGQAPRAPFDLAALQALLQRGQPQGPLRFDQLQSRLQNAGGGGGAGLGIDPMAARMLLMRRLGVLR